MSRLFEAIDGLDIPSSDFIVAGSAPLLVQGVRDAIQDLDIVVRQPVWEKIYSEDEAVELPFDGVQKIVRFHDDLEIEIMNAWFPKMMKWDVDRLIFRAQVIHGVNFMTINQTLAWKQRLGRSKDIEDVRKIKEFLWRRKYERTSGSVWWPACGRPPAP